MACNHCQAAREAAGRALAAIGKGDAREAVNAASEAARAVGDKMADALRIRELTRKR
jgi:hypothetical protein